jgi:hypothetical protein
MWPKHRKTDGKFYYRSHVSSKVSRQLENEWVDKFTEEKFHQYLLKLIVANDQVCLNLLTNAVLTLQKSINVVECPKFRALLLYSVTIWKIAWCCTAPSCKGRKGWPKPI